MFMGFRERIQEGEKTDEQEENVPTEKYHSKKGNANRNSFFLIKNY